MVLFSGASCSFQGGYEQKNSGKKGRTCGPLVQTLSSIAVGFCGRSQANDSRHQHRIGISTLDFARRREKNAWKKVKQRILSQTNGGGFNGDFFIQNDTVLDPTHSWWLNHQSEKYDIVKLDHFPDFQGEKAK